MQDENGKDMNPFHFLNKIIFITDEVPFPIGKGTSSVITTQCTWDEINTDPSSTLKTDSFRKSSPT